MRQNLSHITVTDNLPACPACGHATVFAHAADFARDKRVYFIFQCPSCSAGETRFWRPEWQAMADELTVDED